MNVFWNFVSPNDTPQEDYHRQNFLGIFTRGIKGPVSLSQDPSQTLLEATVLKSLAYSPRQCQRVIHSLTRRPKIEKCYRLNDELDIKRAMNPYAIRHPLLLHCRTLRIIGVAMRQTKSTQTPPVFRLEPIKINASSIRITMRSTPIPLVFGLSGTMMRSMLALSVSSSATRRKLIPTIFPTNPQEFRFVSTFVRGAVLIRVCISRCFSHFDHSLEKYVHAVERYVPYFFFLPHWLYLGYSELFTW
ncbi:hypothetical protein DFS33DRAFT_1346467 [Desarmillaria ectypa]|nr:hypothetical protein DFS33DRAFT_1346467 [Desarmillaria ectypa]